MPITISVSTPWRQGQRGPDWSKNLHNFPSRRPVPPFSPEFHSIVGGSRAISPRRRSSWPATRRPTSRVWCCRWMAGIRSASPAWARKTGEGLVDSNLTFGYLYDFRNPPQWHRPWAELYAEILDFIVWSESVGFQGAWVPEHHGAEDSYMPSPLVMLAAIAARTKTIKLGSAIALAPLYHPVRFAEECAVLDTLCGGRLEMAVAIGYRRREYEAYGVDFSTRGRRTDEFLEIVRRLWAGETVCFEGAHFNLKNASITPKPVSGRIPLYMGGFNAKALDRIAKYGD